MGSMWYAIFPRDINGQKTWHRVSQIPVNIKMAYHLRAMVEALSNSPH